MATKTNLVKPRSVIKPAPKSPRNTKPVLRPVKPAATVKAKPAETIKDLGKEKSPIKPAATTAEPKIEKK